jgi:hypothetical protein
MNFLNIIEDDRIWIIANINQLKYLK